MKAVESMPNQSLLPEDKSGFVVPKTPVHSLMLLNGYMRTNMLRHIHLHIHRSKDAKEPGSPIHYLVRSLEHVLETYEGINLFESFGRNDHNRDPDYEFRPEQDYRHDIKLMKHHLRCHRKTIAEIDGLDDGERALLVEALTALRRDRAKAWNAACDAAEAAEKRAPSLSRFGIDKIARLGRRLGGVTHWSEIDMR